MLRFLFGGIAVLVIVLVACVQSDKPRLSRNEVIQNVQIKGMRLLLERGVSIREVNLAYVVYEGQGKWKVQVPAEVKSPNLSYIFCYDETKAAVSFAGYGDESCKKMGTDSHLLTESDVREMAIRYVEKNYSRTYPHSTSPSLGSNEWHVTLYRPWDGSKQLSPPEQFVIFANNSIYIGINVVINEQTGIIATQYSEFDSRILNPK